MECIWRQSLLILLSTTSICLLLWVVGILTYRLTFHPLGKYPGPLLYRATGLPVLYHVWRGDLQYAIYKLHHKYGDFVRFSPNKLSIATIEAFHDIYGFNKNTSKAEDLYSAFRVNRHAVNTFNTTSKVEHRRKRRIMATAFADSVLPGYENFISERVLELTQKLGGCQEGADAREWRNFNMAHQSFCIILDILGGLCFGEAFGFVAGKGEDVMDQIHKRALRIHMVGQEPFVKRLSLDRVFFPNLFKASNALATYANFHTAQRIRKHENVPNGKSKPASKGYEDILAHLLNSRDKETKSMYNYNELLGEAVLLMLAGSDTGSTALNASLFYLSHNPSSLRKVQAELSQVFDSSMDISPQSARNCNYLCACLDESMRLSPPIPAILPRVVDPGGIKTAGRYIAEGCVVGVPNFTVFRDQRYFARPHDFIPERWIAGSNTGCTEASVKRAKEAFHPFSLGPRQCIGKRLALREITYILAKILYMFDIEAVEDSGKLRGSVYEKLPGIDGQAVLDQFDSFISLESGPVLRFRLKEDVILA